MDRIKNLKYDKDWPNKRRRGYSHLKFLDGIFSIEQAEMIEAIEIGKYGHAKSLKVLPEVKEKKKKEESND